jgi:hypothetical protein
MMSGSAAAYLGPERGAFLTIWLIIIALGNVYGVFQNLGLYRALGERDNSTVPSWPFLAGAILSLVNLACIALLWRWKRLGFYGIVATVLASFVINLCLGVPFGYAILPFVGLAILGAAVATKWDDLE